MSSWKPDFNRLKQVLCRDGMPDIVPFFEYLIDSEIIQELTGKNITTASTVEFYSTYGYDYVMVRADYSYKIMDLEAADTAILSRGARRFNNESEGPIKTRKAFDDYPWKKVDASVSRPMLETASCLPSGMKMIIRPPKGVFENVIRLMGYLPFSYALYEDLSLVEDIFEHVGSNQLAIVKACLENCDISAIGAVAMADDLGYKSGTMIAPKLLREYVFPWHKRIVDLAHSYNLPLILHSCGNIATVMDDLIDYVGIDAKHSFEDSILPVAEAKKRYGKRIAILGGADVHVLCTADEAGIRQYISKIMRDCTPGGGYALGTGNSVANYIPVANYLTMLDEGRKWRA